MHSKSWLGVGAALVLCNSWCHAQVEREWGHRIGKQDPRSYVSLNCHFDAGGNAYVVGFSQLPGPGAAADLLSVAGKFAPDGSRTWVRRHDPLSARSERVSESVLANSGALYIAGWSIDFSAPVENYDFLLYAIDTNGNLLWSHSTGAPGTVESWSGVTLDEQQRPVAAGAAGGNACISAFDAQGQPRWTHLLPRLWSGAHLDRYWDVTALAGGEFLAHGYRYDASGLKQAVMAKYDAAGNLLWERSFAPTSQTAGVMTRVVELDSQRVAFAWDCFSPQQHLNWELGVLNHVQNTVEWTRSRASEGYYSTLADLSVDARGVLWWSGRQVFAGPTEEGVVHRWGLDGSPLSTLKLGVTGVRSSVTDAVFGTAGQCYLIGIVDWDPNTTDLLHRDVYLAQLDSEGSLCWSRTVNLPDSHGDTANCMALGPNARLLLNSGSYSAANLSAGKIHAISYDVSESPQAYCTAKLNSLGCEPRVRFTGISSVGASSGMGVHAENLRNRRAGRWRYSTTGAAALPFQGGVSCLATPIRGTAIVDTGGNAAPANDCSGRLSLDVNAFASGALGYPAPPEFLQPGTRVYFQAWSRDPGASFDSSLSNALTFVLLP